MTKRDLQPSDPYFAAWQDYSRVWQRSVLRSVLLFWGGGIVTLAVALILFPSAPSWVIPVATVPWVVAAIVASQGAVRWRCPRCSRSFHASWWFHNAFARRCVHCRLAKWDPGDAGEKS